MSLPFTLPELSDSLFGPILLSSTSDLDDVPFAPYNKGDKVGRLADWFNKTRDSGFQKQFGANSSSTFVTKLEDEDQDFEFVEKAKSKRAAPGQQARKPFVPRRPQTNYPQSQNRQNNRDNRDNRQNQNRQPYGVCEIVIFLLLTVLS